jgi:hypothetical protein
VHIEHFLGCGGSVAVFEGKWNGTVSSLIVQLKQLLMHHIMVACEGEEVVVKRFHQGKWQSLVKECENLEKVKQLGLMVTEVGDALVLQPVGDHFVTSMAGEVRYQQFIESLWMVFSNLCICGRVHW